MTDDKIIISIQKPNENWERKVTWNISREDILSLSQEDFDALLEEMRLQLIAQCEDS